MDGGASGGYGGNGEAVVTTKKKRVLQSRREIWRRRRRRESPRKPRLTKSLRRRKYVLSLLFQSLKELLTTFSRPVGETNIKGDEQPPSDKEASTTTITPEEKLGKPPNPVSPRLPRFRHY